MTEGTCKPGFERVAEAFQKNFDTKGEVGASVCLAVGGETVVDLWGGTADQKTGAPWNKDTVSIVFSFTKPRRSAPMCWQAAASSTSTHPSPSCGPSLRTTARSARRRA